MRQQYRSVLRELAVPVMCSHLGVKACAGYAYGVRWCRIIPAGSYCRPSACNRFAVVLVACCLLSFSGLGIRNGEALGRVHRQEPCDKLLRFRSIGALKPTIQVGSPYKGRGHLRGILHGVGDEGGSCVVSREDLLVERRGVGVLAVWRVKKQRQR